MTDSKTLPIEKVHVPEDRLRPNDDSRALIIAASIKVRGLIHPITVRSTPNAAAPYTLIAGARRLRAHQLLGLTVINVIVRKADATEARAVEVEENLFRDDLSALQRAYFVREFKTLWEQEHGEIDPKGGRPKNPVNLTGFSSDSAAGQFYMVALDRIGLSEAGVKRCCRIADHLAAELRAKLEGTEASDNQSMLLRLAKMAPADQAKLVRAIDICNGDLDQALATVDPAAAAKPSKDEKTYGTLLTTWGNSNPKVRARFVDALKPREQRELLDLLKSRLGE